MPNIGDTIPVEDVPASRYELEKLVRVLGAEPKRQRKS